MLLDRNMLLASLDGAIDVAEEDGLFRISRFTDEQRAYQYPPDCRFYHPSFRLQGCKLDFCTDSRRLAVDFARVIYKAKDHLYAVDLMQDGALTHHVEGRVDLGFEGLPPAPVPLPDLHYEFDLRPGEKRVEFYFPRLLRFCVKVELDDGAAFAPTKKDRTALVFGDSITASSVVRFPSMAYAPRTFRALNTRMYSFAVGGDVFSENKIVPGTYPKADFILAAYGTNGRKNEEAWQEGMKGFFRALDREFPRTPTFVVLPIHRMGEETASPEEWPLSLPEARARILAECAGHSQVTVLHGENYVPYHDAMYHDGLHPNDLGMSVYAERLTEDLKKHV